MGQLHHDNHHNVRDEATILSLLIFRSGLEYEQIKPQIEELAYRLWENDGKTDGKCMDYWLCAESQLLQNILNGEENGCQFLNGRQSNFVSL